MTIPKGRLTIILTLYLIVLFALSTALFELLRLEILIDSFDWLLLSWILLYQDDWDRGGSRGILFGFVLGGGWSSVGCGLTERYHANEDS